MKALAETPLETPVMEWLQCAAGLTAAGFVIHLVAHLLKGLFGMIAIVALVFALLAFVKEFFLGAQTSEPSTEHASEQTAEQSTEQTK